MGMFDNHLVETKLKRIESAQILSKSGGIARSKALTPEKRAEIAKKAANARWGKMLAG